MRDRENPAEPDSATAGSEVTGLYYGFEAYRTPTDSDYHALLTGGIVVFDTNALLNLYRYNEQTRRDLFDVMRALGDRLWVPHWVMTEFWRNRETVLQDPRNTVGTLRDLSSHRDRTLATLHGWANRVGLPGENVDGLTKTLAESFNTVEEGVKRLAYEEAAEFVRDTNKDPVLAELEPILRGCLGPPLDREAHKRALAEAKLRAEEQRPPGFKDSGKPAERAAGDYLIWVQVLQEAQSKQRDVLIVTGDVKEDWWRKEHGEARGPHPELVEEMKAFANVRLFMLRPESLLFRAGPILQINVRDESLQEVERVDRALQELSAERRSSQLEVFPGLTRIKQDWTEILEDVRGRRKVAWILLTNASATDLTEDTLSIEFARLGDAKGFESSGHGALIKDVLHDRYGVIFDINITYRSKSGEVLAVSPKHD